MVADRLQQAFEEKCHRQGFKITRERQRVFEALLRQEHPVTRSYLLAELTNEGIHPPTLYRTIDAFVAAQIVQAISLSGDVGYELLPPFAPHHHHFHCLSCQRVIGYEVTPGAELDETAMPGEALYHQVDVYGVCNECCQESQNTSSGAHLEVCVVDRSK
ncbi:MAG: Fur family transcriptional regulator [Ferrimicrobium sp.]